MIKLQRCARSGFWILACCTGMTVIEGKDRPLTMFLALVTGIYGGLELTLRDQQHRKDKHR